MVGNISQNGTRVLLVNGLIFLVIGLAYYQVWRLEKSRRIVITPFVFVLYICWIQFYPNFLFSESIGVSNSSYPFLISTLAVLVLLPGFVIGAYSSPVKKNYVESIARRIPRECNRPSALGAAMTVLVGGLVAVSMYFYRGIPDVLEAIVLQFSSNTHEDLAIQIRNARFEQTKSAYFGEEYRGQGLFRIIMLLGWPIAASYYIIKWMIRRKVRYFIYATLVGVMGLIFIASIGSRAPALVYIMMILCSVSVYRPIRIRNLIYGAIGIVFVAIALSAFSTKMHYLLTAPSIQSVQRAVSDTGGRVFFGNASNDVRVIELVESGIWQLRWGQANLRNLITAIPGVRYGMPLSHELHLELNPGSAGTTFASGTYMSIIYIDFGIGGVIVGYALIGFVIGYIQRIYFTRVISDPLLLATLAGPIFYSVAYLLVVGISGFLARSVILASMVMMLLTIEWLMKKSVVSKKAGGNGFQRFRKLPSGHSPS